MEVKVHIYGQCAPENVLRLDHHRPSTQTWGVTLVVPEGPIRGGTVLTQVHAALCGSAGSFHDVLFILQNLFCGRVTRVVEETDGNDLAIPNQPCRGDWSTKLSRNGKETPGIQKFHLLKHHLESLRLNALRVRGGVRSLPSWCGRRGRRCVGGLGMEMAGETVARGL